MIPERKTTTVRAVCCLLADGSTLITGQLLDFLGYVNVGLILPPVL